MRIESREPRTVASQVRATLPPEVDVPVAQVSFLQTLMPDAEAQTKWVKSAPAGSRLSRRRIFSHRRQANTPAHRHQQALHAAGQRRIRRHAHDQLRVRGAPRGLALHQLQIFQPQLRPRDDVQRKKIVP